MSWATVCAACRDERLAFPKSSWRRSSVLRRRRVSEAGGHSNGDGRFRANSASKAESEYVSLVVPAPRSSAARRASWTDVRESSFPSPVSFGSVGGGTSGWALAPAPIGLLGVTGRQKKIPVAGPSPGLQKLLFHLKQPRRGKLTPRRSVAVKWAETRRVGPRAADQADTPMRSRPKDAALQIALRARANARGHAYCGTLAPRPRTRRCKHLMWTWLSTPMVSAPKWRGNAHGRRARDDGRR